MFVGITNTPRDYAWGSRGAISALLGWPRTQALEAELWLGAHPGSPSRILDPSIAGGATDLAEWIAADPEAALGSKGGDRLPFLLKVLAADSALSLQAHPNAEQARAGFERENAAGIPLDAPNRNYKDPYPKPEMIYALEDGFDALCGFRPMSEVRAVIERLLRIADRSAAVPQLQRWLELSSGQSPQHAFEWLISRGDGVAQLIEDVVAASRTVPEFELVTRLAAAYPGDPGILIALMLNRVTLMRGEALYLGAGVIHAYLHGIGVELMTASDNVLRGGLTPKYVDVAELLAVVSFSSSIPEKMRGEHVGQSITVFWSDPPAFSLSVATADGVISSHGASIVLSASGHFEILGVQSHAKVSRGELLFATPDEAPMTLRGEGLVFIAQGSV
jgi:mannose-6-phosphate isomerase